VQTSRPADLTGQVAIVTGAARSIGQACAWALAAAGADVVAADLGPATPPWPASGSWAAGRWTCRPT
jgi:NAD(P)-dependent dehydrogenase (short-subunit alcohol dehydrogenase family)